MSFETKPDPASLKIVGGTIVAFDGTSHRILADGEIVVEGDTIASVGKRTDRPAERTIDLGNRLAIPGFVSTHAHVGAHEATRSLLDAGRRDFMRTGFLNFMPRKGPDAPNFYHKADREASLRYGLGQLLRNGVTTVVGFDPNADSLLPDLAVDYGIRLYFAPTANPGKYWFDKEGRLSRTLDEDLALAQLEQNARFISDHDGRGNGRFRGIVVVDEFFNATPELLKRAKKMAAELGVGITMHFCEQLFEFYSTVRETGRTPVQLLADLGVLGPELILGHCMYVAGNPMTNYPYVDDLAILAESGTAVAHSPFAFARRGVIMRSLPKYIEAGITVGMGTDTFPQDMLEEMRTASMAAKIAELNHETVPAATVFDAATLGSAKALRRSDLGRIAPGAKADIVIVDLDNIWTAPYVDPIRALVVSAHPSMIDTVIVDGIVRVDDGRLLEHDEAALIKGAEHSMDQVASGYPEWHWAGRTMADEFPQSYTAWV